MCFSLLIGNSVTDGNWEPWESQKLRFSPLTGTFPLEGPLCCCSVTKLCPTLGNAMDCSTPGCPLSLSPGVYSHSRLLSRWCHPTTSSSEGPLYLSSVTFHLMRPLRVSSSNHPQPSLGRLEILPWQAPYRSDRPGVRGNSDVGVPPTRGLGLWNDRDHLGRVEGPVLVALAL